MPREPKVQEAHATQMEKAAQERHAENAGFYDTAGQFSNAAKIMLGLGAAGVGAGKAADPRPSPTASHAMGRAEAVYSGKASGPAKRVAKGIKEYPSASFDSIKRNSDLYKKWASSAREAGKMATQAARGVAPFAEGVARATSPALMLGAAPLAMASLGAGSAGTPYADMHFNAFRLLERPLRSDDVGEEDYQALVDSPDMAKDLFSVGAISFELYRNAGNARVEAEVQRKEAALLEQYEVMSLGQQQQQDRLNAAREALRMEAVRRTPEAARRKGALLSEQDLEAMEVVRAEAVRRTPEAAREKK